MSRSVLLTVFSMLLIAGCAAGASGAGKEGKQDAISGTLLTVFDSSDPRAAAKSRGVKVSSQGVRVDVQTQGLQSDDRSRFEVDGVHVHHFSAKYERVAVSVRDREALRRLAQIEPVRRLTPEYGAADRSDAAGGNS